MRGRTVFMDSLVANGVTHIFGNPGTTENPLLDSLIDYPQIEYVLHLHEGVAVGAASYYAQATGKTGVANLHVAPGLGNAIGMLYGALRSESPMVVTAGQQDTRLRLHDPVLQHDLVAMAAPVTKWSVQAERADELALMLRRAFKIAHQPPAGPVFVGLPVDVMEQETEHGAQAPGTLFRAARADEAGIAAMAEVLRTSQRPVIVVGDEVARCGAHQQVQSLCEAIGAGVWNELLRIHTTLPTDHPHYCGSLWVDRTAIRAAMEGCDAVLLVGGAFFDVVWFDALEEIPEATRVLHIDNAPERLAKKVPVEIGVVGDIGDAVARLTDAVSKAGGASFQQAAAARSAEIAERNRAQREAAARKRAADQSTSPMSVGVAMREIAAALPNDAVVIDETITGIADVVANFTFRAPGDAYGTRGGGIGLGIAGALGLSVATPDRLVVALSGDGSAMYSIQALWTAAHHGLDILFVILSNREYRILKHNIDAYRQRFGAPADKPYPQMDLTQPQLGFADIARGMGVAAQEISDPAQLGDAVRRAVAAGGPHLLDVVVAGLEASPSD